MNIIKELPEIFEEFAEQKKQSFLIVKECKDRHIPGHTAPISRENWLRRWGRFPSGCVHRRRRR